MRPLRRFLPRRIRLRPLRIGEFLDKRWRFIPLLVPSVRGHPGSSRLFVLSPSEDVVRAFVEVGRQRRQGLAEADEAR
jgi:hypothetical protein